MAWFVIQCERRTWTKYLVEADSEESAFQSSDNWQYLGYLDGDDTDSSLLGGPFRNKAEALADILTYVEGAITSE